MVKGLTLLVVTIFAFDLVVQVLVLELWLKIFSNYDIAVSLLFHLGFNINVINIVVDVVIVTSIVVVVVLVL